MLSFLDVAIKFLYSSKKGLTFFYKVVEDSDFDVGISYFVEIIIGMDRYFIVPDCAVYIIYILTYACIIGVIIGQGVVVICTDFIVKVVIYRIFTESDIFYKTFIYKPFYLLRQPSNT